MAQPAQTHGLRSTRACLVVLLHIAGVGTFAGATRRHERDAGVHRAPRRGIVWRELSRAFVEVALHAGDALVGPECVEEPNVEEAYVPRRRKSFRQNAEANAGTGKACWRVHRDPPSCARASEA